MRIEWNQYKNRLNKAKHGVAFETASLVFEDPEHLSIADRREGYEERWQTMGLVQGVLILLVVHTVIDGENTENEEIIRIISARKATKKERYCYEKKVTKKES